jgi:hypothetical protein
MREANGSLMFGRSGWTTLSLEHGLKGELDTVCLAKGESMAENPSATLPAIVEKIIKPPYAGAPEKAQIVVEGADELYREIRIENTLTDENDQKVGLKLGAEVQVTVEAEPEDTTPKA